MINLKSYYILSCFTLLTFNILLRHDINYHFHINWMIHCILVLFLDFSTMLVKQGRGLGKREIDIYSKLGNDINYFVK